MLNLFDFTFNHQFYLTLSPFGPASPLSPVSPLKPCTSTLRYICTCHCIAYLYYPVWVRLTSFSAWFSWTYLLTHYSFYLKLGLRRPSISVLCVRLLLFLFHSSCFNIPQWDTPPHVFTKGLTPLCQTWVAASHDLWCTLTSCVERSLRFCPYMQKTCCTCRYWSIVCIYSCEVYLAVVDQICAAGDLFVSREDSQCPSNVLLLAQTDHAAGSRCVCLPLYQFFRWPWFERHCSNAGELSVPAPLAGRGEAVPLQ